MRLAPSHASVSAHKARMGVRTSANGAASPGSSGSSKKYRGLTTRSETMGGAASGANGGGGCGVPTRQRRKLSHNCS